MYPIRCDNLAPMTDLRKILALVIFVTLDIAALAVSAAAGILAMPLGGLYGAVFVGAMVFVLTWRTLGSSKKVWTKRFNPDTVVEKGANESEHP